MERELPTFDIKGTAFIVDVDYNLLRHPEKEGFTISFLYDMEDMGTHYLLSIDKETLHPIAPYLKDSGDENTVVYNVPQMVNLDPDGVAEKYGVSRKSLPNKDIDCKMDPDLFKNREMGTLPILEIIGHQFYIDVRVGWIRPKDDFSTWGLELSKMEYDDSGTRLLCLYDPEQHTTVEPDMEMTEIPEGIVVLRIPADAVLDSYAVAREYGILDDTEWFRKFPVRTGMKAEVIPWEKTEVPALIAKNRAKKKREPKHRNKGRSL